MRYGITCLVTCNALLLLVVLVCSLVVHVCPFIVPVVLFVGLVITDLLVLLNQKKVMPLGYHVQASFIKKNDKYLYR